jgi:hypothetical protein
MMFSFSNLSSPERTKEVPQLLHEGLTVLKGQEVPTAKKVPPIHHVEVSVQPTARWRAQDIICAQHEAGRHLDTLPNR